ncbi:hypothetical protein OSB04_023347 [Centaurea solstitialis]|uniref:Uncharacterized protein n=1 Tax=Centaurea solstitialis TaxID=347529 RepID=A0AA38SWE1_9ASTR|nr:hypothetical protein OSB04_023347 [Centaurea solstitialis]
MAALLNLSISPQNKSRIVQAGVIPEIINVMNSGSLKACEDGATILLTLSYLSDDVKFLIGSHEGLRPLVYLLREGSERGQKEAVAALFNLCLLPCNIKRAVEVGVVSEIIWLMGQWYYPVRDEALALLNAIVNHHDVLRALEREPLIYYLKEFFSRGSRKNQEDAASVLLQLFSINPRYVEEARELGVGWWLLEVQQYGSDEGKRKASDLLANIATYVGNRTGIKRPRIDHTCEASTSRSKPRPRGGTD